MAESESDAKLSKAILVMRAIYGHDDEDVLAVVLEYVSGARAKLGAHVATPFNEGLKGIHEDLSGLHIFLCALEVALRKDGDSEFKIEFKRRKAGKPINRMQRARVGHRAAGIVERAVADGTPTESAIADAVKQTGVSRSEIFRWLAWSKKLSERVAKKSG